MAIQKHNHHHFLLVSVEAQGHINPARRLAHHLVRYTGARATLAVPTSAYRTMFPSAVDETEQTDGLIFYTHYSSGSEQGLSFSKDLPATKLHIKDSLSLLAKDLAACGRPVTCIIYALLLSMAADVARELSIPSALFWIQPAAVFSIYNSYFHGYTEIIHAHHNDPSFTIALPRLPPLQIRDLPSFVTTPISDDNPYTYLYLLLKDVFENLDRESAASRPRVLVNTFQELESDVLSSIEETELIAVGPLMSTSELTLSKGSEHSQGDLYQEDLSGYMAWLDTQMERSVVYVSFGSISKLSGRQMEEIRKGLTESGRPYLWVVRRDNEEREKIEGGEMGMVVEWCSQDKVLAHSSIGCFVTHCGWNSTLESMVGGVPMVMVPQWTDQMTNARLAEGEWGTGVRAAVEDGVLEGSELQRCLELMMGEEDQGKEIRRRAAMWREKAVAAMGQGGSSCRNLTAFVQSLETVAFRGTELSSLAE